MAAARKRLVFMTGAPVAADLSYTEQNCNEELCLRLRRYLGIVSQDDDRLVSSRTESPESQHFPKWRDVPFRNGDTTPEAPKFLSFHESDLQQPSQEHMIFLQHSLGVLQTLDSSQICVAPDETAYNETTFVSALSFNSDTSLQTSYGGSFSTNATGGEPLQQTVNFTGQIMDLKRVPTARHLESIHPQTMTINVLAGVISVQPTRTVRLRKRSGEMEIVEVLLGDDTRAGFSLSFWLPPAAAHEDDSNTRQFAGRSGPSRTRTTGSLKHILDEVRSGDTLLITHVALGVFNGTVYGQSLSRRITRNNTSLVRLSEDVVGLPAPVVAKMKRVKEWTANFVGRPAKRAASPAGLESVAVGKRPSFLPPDTQPGFL